MSMRVVATGRVRALEPHPAELVAGEVWPVSRRTCHLALLDEDVEVDVYDSMGAPPGSTISGPAIVEHPLTTIQVPRGWTLSVDAWRNYVLSADTAHSTTPRSFEDDGVRTVSIEIESTPTADLVDPVTIEIFSKGP